MAAASSGRAPRPPTGQPSKGARRPSAHAVNGPRRMAAPEMPACCTARSNRSGSRWVASTMPARCSSHAQEARCHWRCTIPLR
eukprot:4244609-Alexandrium_andersonii.AAC.1